ncbi:toxic anion resistance protein [Schinkia azotoformans]|uniref:toxic anion resistance protein n=1 Tax=Schinkia azotoformans TaxID=1454 RepID=UPI002DBE8831|nr:toxic anion resistance protein [Schinkia azotoformans]MEC1720139.1 toxic anion resistance protein [Schinkia azotoformans]MED4414146.1 toxic anion resistance protein [Schinkia azotoformans]
MSNEIKASNETNNALDDLLANPFGEIETEPVVTQFKEDRPRRMIDSLPEVYRQKAMELATQINPKDQQTIIQFGTAAQTKLSNFSHSMLEHVQKKDTGPIGDILKELMQKLEQVNPEELSGEKKNIFKRIFNKVSTSVNEILSKYQKIGSQIDKIGVKLDHQKNILLTDNKMLDELFQKNKEYFDGLNIYIAAGELKLEELHAKDIPALKQKAEQSDDQMVYQDLNDLVQFADRLEKRLHDLKLSRQITIQSAPQIRMIQNMNQALVEKIQSSILTAIPLWKNQITIALTLYRQKRAVEAQKQVSKTTNELLLKNAEMLKTNSIETAIENERGLVDIETLKKTQENLITTLQETIRIQHEGRMKRQQAEQELIKMEDEMKQTLLSLK